MIHMDIQEAMKFLKAVANSLRDACGENVIGRVGGEEFIAVLENKEAMSLKRLLRVNKKSSSRFINTLSRYSN